ncbi:MAG: hypothetical protein ACYCU0_10130 [Solirubrobacteraceae bacterium]
MRIPGTKTARRAAKAAPAARLLAIGELALMTGRHLQRLNGEERRRLGMLVFGAGLKRGRLEAHDRDELHRLVAKLEPRLLVGDAVARLSPVPLPKRLLYGKRTGGKGRRRTEFERRRQTALERRKQMDPKGR